MKESERHAAVVRLWFELPKAEREGITAVSRFHAWLLLNHPELLSKASGDSYQHFKEDLRNSYRHLMTDRSDYITWG